MLIKVGDMYYNSDDRVEKMSTRKLRFFYLDLDEHITNLVESGQVIPIPVFSYYKAIVKALARKGVPITIARPNV